MNVLVFTLQIIVIMMTSKLGTGFKVIGRLVSDSCASHMASMHRLHMSTYKESIHSSYEHLLEVQNSKFIARIKPIASIEEGLEWVKKSRREDPKASHHCWAMHLSGPMGKDVVHSRFSDDGEPLGTAGRPILAAIEGESLTNLVVVVCRYFGGTKLGTGGLARAYGGSVREGLKLCTRITLVPHREVVIKIPSKEIAAIYTVMRRIESTVTDQKGKIEGGLTKLSEGYEGDSGQSYVTRWRVPLSLCDQLEVQLFSLTKGQSVLLKV